MKRIFLLFLAFILVFIFAGCAKRVVTTPDTQEVPKGTAQKAATPESVKIAETAKEAPVATKEEPKKVETVPVKEVVESRTIATPEKVVVSSKPPAVFEDIHFDLDKYTIMEDAKPTLKAVADWLIKNADAKMIFEGHCDDRGTNEYNIALGEKRAKSAMDYIVSAGVTKNRLDTISYGEEKPLCEEQTEECWQKNRRVQFIIQPTSGTAGK